MYILSHDSQHFLSKLYTWYNVYMKKKIIVANWKMNPQTIGDAKKIFITFKKKKLPTDVIPVICPPFVFLNELKRMYLGGKIFFGAQDVHWLPEGSATGEISTAMLASLGCSYVIVGHSERRALGETNQMVAQKTKAILDAKLTPIICVGEPHRDVHGKYLKFIEEQLNESLSLVTRPKAKNIIVAYEPIWSIGKGGTAIDSHGLHQMSIYIRKVLINLFGKKTGMSIPILYGGSTNSDNARELVYEGEVDGLLVGRSSRNPDEFAEMIKNIA